MKCAILAFFLALGCALMGCQTLTRDSDQQVRKYSRIADINRRMLADDVDTILLLDEPSSLTSWYVPTN